MQLSLETSYFAAKRSLQCALHYLWFVVLGTGAGAAKGRVKTGQELWDVPGVWTECQCLPSMDLGDQVCSGTLKLMISMPHTPFYIRMMNIYEGRMRNSYSVYTVLKSPYFIYALYLKLIAFWIDPCKIE